MVNKKYKIQFTEKDRTFLQQFVSTGKRSAREFLRAMALLLSDKGKTDEEICEILNVSTCTIQRARQKYAIDGLNTALFELPRPGQPACSDAPEGRSHWTLELLREEAVKRDIVNEISTEPIRILLKRHDIKPWKKKMWCIPELTDTFIERMMDILEVYERPYNPQEPVICLDEKSMQLLAHVREPIPITPGAPERYDSEYKRRGTANIFVMVEPKAGIRHLIIKERKRYEEYAVCMDFLSTVYSDINKIIVIQDNFRTHSKNH